MKQLVTIVLNLPDRAQLPPVPLHLNELSSRLIAYLIEQNDAYVGDVLARTEPSPRA